MARSIHVTKKQLMRERWFTHTDAVPPSGPTDLEQQDITKSVHKTNEAFLRQAVRDDVPLYARIEFDGSEVTRTTRKRRWARPLPTA